MNALSVTAAAPVRAGWLVDRRQDLLSTVGGLGASLVLLGLHLWGGVSSVLLWWAWILVLDGPHIFATVSRTYLDRRERERRRRLLGGLRLGLRAAPLLPGSEDLAGEPRQWAQPGPEAVLGVRRLSARRSASRRPPRGA